MLFYAHLALEKENGIMSLPEGAHGPTKEANINQRIIKVKVKLLEYKVLHR